MPSWPCAEAVDLTEQRGTRANKYRSRQKQPPFNSVQLAGSGRTINATPTQDRFAGVVSQRREMQLGLDLIVFYSPGSYLVPLYPLSFHMFLHGTGTALQFTPLCRISSHLPHSKFRDWTFHEGKRNSVTAVERTPSSSEGVAARRSKNRAWCLCSDKWNFFMTSTRCGHVFLAF